MATKTLKYYQISSYSYGLGDKTELNFDSRELVNDYILKELFPKNWEIGVKLDNLTITKKEKVWVDRAYPVYYKNDPKRVKKMIEERVQEDKYTETHNFEGYVNGQYKWREQINGWHRDNEKPVGYYVFKIGEIAHEITKDSVIFRAPVYVQFIKAELIVTPEIKVDGQPYQARKEEIKEEVVSEWLPVYVINSRGQFDQTKYGIDPEWTDRSWWKGAEPYFAAIEYYVGENAVEIVTEL